MGERERVRGIHADDREMKVSVDLAYISFYRNRTQANPKPLLITEFGVDAMGSQTYESYNLESVPRVCFFYI